MKEDNFVHLKHRLPGIKTLAMLKMEKNFIALVEKGYPRQPYNDKNQSISFLINRIGDELLELRKASEFGSVHEANWLGNVSGMMEECADISNLIDYLFEKLAKEAA